MDKWEMRYGRSALFDSLDRMRSATTAAQTCEEMTVLASTLLFGSRSARSGPAWGQRSKASAGDCTALFRGLLQRNLFYQYARQIFPKLNEMLAVYGTWNRYHLHYGMDEHGRLQQGAATSDDEDNGHDKDEDGCQTRFESKRKLKVFMYHIAMGKHDQSFTNMARHTSSSTNLDLGCEGMKHAQQLLSEIWAL